MIGLIAFILAVCVMYILCIYEFIKFIGRFSGKEEEDENR